MHRIYFLIGLLLFSLDAFSQTIREMEQLLMETNASNFPPYLKAAREDGDSSKVILVNGLLGNCHVKNHQYFEAEKVLLQCTDYIGRLSPNLKFKYGNSLSLYDCYDYLSKLYIETGNYRKARLYLNLSHKKKQAYLPKGSLSRIANSQLLTSYYLRKNQMDSAGFYLNVFKKEIKRTKQASKSLLNSLFLSYYKGMTEYNIGIGDITHANHYLKRAIEVYQPLRLNSDHVNDPEIILLKSRLLLLTGEHAKAIGTAQKIMTRKNIDSLKVYPECLRIKVEGYFRSNMIDEAFHTGKELINIDLRNISRIFSNLTETEKEDFNNKVQFDFNLLTAIAYYASKHNLKFPYYAELLSFRLNAKGLLLNNTQQMRSLLMASQSQQVKVQYSHLLNLKKRLADLYTSPAKEGIYLLNDSIEVLERQLNIEVGKASLPGGVRADDIRSALAENDQAIEMVGFRKYGIKFNFNEDKRHPVYGLTDSLVYLSFIVNHDKIETCFIENGNILNTRYLKFYEHTISSQTRDTRLYDFFWKDLNAKIGNGKRIFFSGDGVYNQINLNVVADSAGYLFDRYDFINLTNLATLTTQSTRPAITYGNAVFVGRPNFEGIPATNRGLSAFDLGDVKNESFSDLPGTEKEITQAEAILSSVGWKTHTFIGNTATESTMKGIYNPKILHVATHGFFLPGDYDSNPMLQTGLVFSGVSSKTHMIGDDGILTAYESMSLTLDSTDLVVLSACETGLGKIKDGEGVYGLQRAFEIAGAKNIVMSMWKVDDTATQKLMTYFYENLVQFKDVRKAFREAQIKLREEFPAPYYWGAFVLNGY